MNFGNTLKDYRIGMDFTQGELAKALGISQAFMCMIEQGQKTLPVIYIPRVAEVLGVSIESIVREMAKDYEARLMRGQASKKSS